MQYKHIKRGTHILDIQDPDMYKWQQTKRNINRQDEKSVIGNKQNISKMQAKYNVVVYGRMGITGNKQNAIQMNKAGYALTCYHYINLQLYIPKNVFPYDNVINWGLIIDQ